MAAAPDEHRMDRRTLLRYGLGSLGAAAVGATVLGGCGSSSKSAVPTTTSTPQPADTSLGGKQLLAAAQKEGRLTTAAIGEPHSYYAPVVAAFEKFAGFTIDLQHPSYIATAQVADLDNAATSKMKPPYDVVEVTEATADQAMDKDLLSPYVSSLWVDIPSSFKDADGYWSAAYYGLVSFVVDADDTDGFVPESWDQLASSKKTPKGSFAMLGDPRTGRPFEGGLGLLTVISAAMANGGSIDDIEPGLALLGQLVEKKIFDVKDSSSLLALPDVSGDDKTSINALYSFDLPLARQTGKAKGTKVEGKAPSDGLVAGFYPQAIAAGSPHEAAAQLWLEFIQSDQAAGLFLANGAIPTRASVIANSGSKELREALPPEDHLSAPVPSVSQITAAQKVVDEKWSKYLPVDE